MVGYICFVEFYILMWNLSAPWLKGFQVTKRRFLKKEAEGRVKPYTLPSVGPSATGGGKKGRFVLDPNLKAGGTFQNQKNETLSQKNETGFHN